jgi:hypothetical protein
LPEALRLQFQRFWRGEMVTDTGRGGTDKRPEVLIDAVSLAMWDAISDHQRFGYLYRHSADDILRQAFGCLVDGRWLAYDEAMPYIEKFQNLVEIQMAELAGSHSIPYWLMLCHRIRPDADGIGVTPWTEQLARRVLDAAIFKYGRLECSELPTDVVHEDGFLRPAVIDKSAVFNAYRLERLALELYWSTGSVRRLVKNGWLRVIVEDATVSPLVENSREDRRLIELYDKRCCQYDGPGTSSGLIAADKVTHSESGDKPYEIYIPYINSHGFIVPMLWIDEHNRPHKTPFFQEPGIEGPSNYIVGPFDLEPYSRFMMNAGVTVGQATPQEVISLLVTICTWEFTRALQHLMLMREFYQRGYIHVDIDALFLAIAPECLAFRRRAFRETLSMKTCRAGMADAYHALCLAADKRMSMSVLHHSACPVFVSVSRTETIVNLWSIPFWIEEFTTVSARVGGDIGTIRGRLLEAAIISTMRDALPDCVLWKKAHEVLKLNDGSLMDIDASYVRGSLLVMIEDKNAVHSEKFELGSKGAPIQEFTKFNNDLNGLRENAGRLLANRVGKNYRLPDEVSVVLPVIVTSEVKYIAVERPDLFLDRDTPVVCTIDELTGFLSRTDNTSIARLPCATRQSEAS